MSNPSRESTPNPTAGQPEALQAGLPPPVEFQPLDHRVVKLWRIGQAISSAILMGLATLAGAIVSFTVLRSWPWALAALGTLAVVRAWLFFWYPPRAYRAWGYRIDSRVIETRSGVWFKVTQLLPLSRLQHVDLHSGPIERSFGLASLLLHTAGTHNATITIPGLDALEASRLRDYLVSIGGDDAV